MGVCSTNETTELCSILLAAYKQMITPKQSVFVPFSSSHLCIKYMPTEHSDLIGWFDKLKNSPNLKALWIIFFSIIKIRIDIFRQTFCDTVLFSVAVYQLYAISLVMDM